MTYTIEAHLFYDKRLIKHKRKTCMHEYVFVCACACVCVIRLAAFIILYDPLIPTDNY